MLGLALRHNVLLTGIIRKHESLPIRRFDSNESGTTPSVIGANSRRINVFILLCGHVGRAQESCISCMDKCNDIIGQALFVS